jgi:putative transposase
MHKRKLPISKNWRMDETYIKVAGKDRYLYRAVDKYGQTVDLLLTKRRMKGSAQKFLNKAIGHNGKPRVINIDRSGANKSAIRSVNRDLLSVRKIKVRQCKYLNNIVEQDHRNIKRRISIATGFKEFDSAQRTLAGIEIINVIRKGQIADSGKNTFLSNETRHLHLNPCTLPSHQHTITSKPNLLTTKFSNSPTTHYSP